MVGKAHWGEVGFLEANEVFTCDASLRFEPIVQRNIGMSRR
jgi:hypothetical protein